MEYSKILTEVIEIHKTFMRNHPHYRDNDLHDPSVAHLKEFIERLYEFVDVKWYSTRMTPEEFKKEMLSRHVKPMMEDVLKITKEQKELQALKTSLLGQQDVKLKYFITIGFNHQTFNIPAAVSVIRSVCSNKIFKNIRGVFEMFRENGEHPHVHFLAELSEPLAKSKILEKLWATKGIKKQVLSKTFIDVKKAEEYHENYILGIKKKEKLEYIEKDKIFRDKNNIPHFFSQP